MLIKNYYLFLFLFSSFLFFGCNRTESNDDENNDSIREEVFTDTASTIKVDSTIELLKKDETNNTTKANDVPQEVIDDPAKSQSNSDLVITQEKIEKGPEPINPKKTEPSVVITQPDKTKKEAENQCPGTLRPLLDFDNKNGLLSCVISPESTNYHYYLVISKSKNFSGANIVKSFDLKLNSVFPLNSEQREMLKKIKEYANLYFRYEVYCESTKFLSQVEGPLSISCRDSGECQIMR